MLVTRTKSKKNSGKKRKKTTTKINPAKNQTAAISPGLFFLLNFCCFFSIFSDFLAVLLVLPT